MTKREDIIIPELGMYVFHDNLYNGRELMKIVGIRKDEIELKGDYSGGTHKVIQRDWLPIKGAFRIRKICSEHENGKTCQLHNLHCGYPNCEPYLTVNNL